MVRAPNLLGVVMPSGLVLSAVVRALNLRGVVVPSGLVLSAVVRALNLLGVVVPSGLVLSAVVRALNLLGVVVPSGRVLSAVVRVGVDLRVAGRGPEELREGNPRAVVLRGVGRALIVMARAAKVLRVVVGRVPIAMARVSDGRPHQSMRSARLWRSGVGRSLRRVSPHWLRSSRPHSLQLTATKSMI